jgi:hypothetical protein
MKKMVGKLLEIKILKIISFLLLISLFGLGRHCETEAKSNLSLYDEDKVELGNATVEREEYSKKSESDPSYTRTAYRLYITIDGNRELLVDDTRYSYISNGSEIYYIKLGTYIKDCDIDSLYKTSVYRYRIADKSEQKIASSTGLDFRQCAKTNYIYLTYQKKNFIWDQYGLFVLDISKGKLKKLGNNNQNSVAVYKNRVVVYESGGDICNVNIYSYKLNGTDKKYIANAQFDHIKKGMIYFIKTKSSKTGLLYRGYRCSMLGKKKKAVTKWLKEGKFSW